MSYRQHVWVCGVYVVLLVFKMTHRLGVFSDLKLSYWQGNSVPVLETSHRDKSETWLHVVLYPVNFIHLWIKLLHIEKLHNAEVFQFRSQENCGAENKNRIQISIFFPESLKKAAAIEEAEERLALISNTYMSPLKTHYGN